MVLMESYISIQSFNLNSGTRPCLNFVAYWLFDLPESIAYLLDYDLN